MTNFPLRSTSNEKITLIARNAIEAKKQTSWTTFLSNFLLISPELFFLLLYFFLPQRIFCNLTFHSFWLPKNFSRFMCHRIVHTQQTKREIRATRRIKERKRRITKRNVFTVTFYHFIDMKRNKTEIYRIGIVWITMSCYYPLLPKHLSQDKKKNTSIHKTFLCCCWCLMNMPFEVEPK